jgi:hypothetical protein
MRAVKGHFRPPSGEEWGRRRRSEGSSQAILLARRTHTFRKCSFDARNEG